MNHKDKTTHVDKAIAKATLYEQQAIEDKKDIRAAIEALQNVLDKKDNHQPPPIWRSLGPLPVVKFPLNFLRR